MIVSGVGRTAIENAITTSDVIIKHSGFCGGIDIINTLSDVCCRMCVVISGSMMTENHLEYRQRPILHLHIYLDE